MGMILVFLRPVGVPFCPFRPGHRGPRGQWGPLAGGSGAAGRGPPGGHCGARSAAEGCSETQVRGGVMGSVDHSSSPMGRTI